MREKEGGVHADGFWLDFTPEGSKFNADHPTVGESLDSAMKKDRG